MSKETGMTSFDIVSSLHSLGMFGVKDRKCVLKIDRKAVDEYMVRTEKRRALRIELDSECLRWTPVVSTQMLLDEERQAEAEVCLVFIYYWKVLIATTYPLASAFLACFWDSFRLLEQVFYFWDVITTLKTSNIWLDFLVDIVLVF